MVCFCAVRGLPDTSTRAAVNVMPTPEQLPELEKLLDLQASSSEDTRADHALAQRLPANPDWLRSRLAAKAPGGIVPDPLPAQGGPALAMAARLAVPATMFPLDDAQALTEALTDTMAGLQAQLAAAATPLSSMPSQSLQDLAHGARVTLALQAKGLCPFELMQAETREARAAGAQVRAMTEAEAASAAKYGAAMQYAARMQATPPPPFALPPDKLKLAQDLAALNAVTSAHPGGIDTAAVEAIRKRLETLMQVPVPETSFPLDALMAQAAEMADLDVIHQAFGADALTPQGQARINAMFRHWSGKRITVPSQAAALRAQLDGLPDMDEVLDGARAANAADPALLQAMTMAVPQPPVVPVLEVISALASALARAAGTSPTEPCIECGLSMMMPA